MSLRSRHTTVLVLCAAVLVPLQSAGIGAAAGERVKIESGEVEGVASERVIAFKGIPFAAPPVGNLRWRAPQPAAPWTGVRAANAYGHDCMQEPFGGDAAPLGTPPDEDCLVLNVWTPKDRGATPLPVMFWIYGGGFVNGGSSPEVYSGTHFAESGVVFVSANYRLGRFGFFAHPALSKEDTSALLGNYGYLDQIAALKWVQRNIAAFGGDPGNVTIFGESAGGMSVTTLMTSPLGKGLFHKAIVESGGGRPSTLVATRSINKPGPKGEPSGERAGVAFAKQMNIAGDDAAALAALRQLPASRLVNGMNLMKQQPDTYVGPMLDGKIVVEDVDTAFKAGHQARIPFIVGANGLEFGFAPVPANRTDEVLAQFGADRDKALAAYDPQQTGNKGVIGMALMSDLAMVEPARMLARLTDTAGQPTWQYRFSYVASSLRGKVAGALHATEIPFVFNTERVKYGDATTAEDEATGRMTNAYWVAFAKTGDPNGAGLPKWPRYSAAEDAIMDFTTKGPVAGPDPFKARLDVVEALASKRNQ
jgi:para-nitrobenzyl esterase